MDEALNWQSITDHLAFIKIRRESGEFSESAAEEERKLLREACGGFAVDTVWEITQARHAVAHRKTKTPMQQTLLVLDAAKHAWPPTWPEEWVKIKDHMINALQNTRTGTSGFHSL